MNTQDDTQVICQCQDCVQFQVLTHDLPDLERRAYTVNTYGAVPLKPEYSSRVVSDAAQTLKVGA